MRAIRLTAAAFVLAALSTIGASAAQADVPSDPPTNNGWTWVMMDSGWTW